MRPREPLKGLWTKIVLFVHTSVDKFEHFCYIATHEASPAATSATVVRPRLYRGRLCPRLHFRSRSPLWYPCPDHPPSHPRGRNSVRRRPWPLQTSLRLPRQLVTEDHDREEQARLQRDRTMGRSMENQEHEVLATGSGGEVGCRVRI